MYDSEQGRYEYRFTLDLQKKLRKGLRSDRLTPDVTTSDRTAAQRLELSWNTRINQLHPRDGVDASRVGQESRFEMNPENPLSPASVSEAARLCGDLIRAVSVNPPGDELGAAQVAAAFLEGTPFQLEWLEHGPGRASLLARLPGSGQRPAVLASGHLDTVTPGSAAWERPPFSGDEADGRVWGRGAADMKGGVAALLVAARAFARAHPRPGGDLLLALTAGEEVDCLGAQAIARRTDLPAVGLILVAEPSANEIFIAEKGALWLELTTHGKTAHGSMPDLGRNAVRDMLALLEEIDRLEFEWQAHPLLGGFTISLNGLIGGGKANVVPDECRALFDLRTVPGQEHAGLVAQFAGVLRAVETTRPGLRAELSVLTDRPPITTSPEHPVVERFQTARRAVVGSDSQPAGVRYFSDAAILAPALGAPMIICGPGEAGMAHQPDEWVEVRRLDEAASIYEEVFREFLGWEGEQ